MTHRCLSHISQIFQGVGSRANDDARGWHGPAPRQFKEKVIASLHALPGICKKTLHVSISMLRFILFLLLKNKRIACGIPLFWCNIEAAPNKLCVSVSKPNFSAHTRERKRGGGGLETSPSEHIQIKGVGVEERGTR
jgi:hypothetical protein